MKKFFFPIILFFLYLISVSPAYALQVSPLRETMVVDPGKTTSITLHAKNDENDPFFVETSVSAFTIDPKDGHAIFGAKDSAVSWIQAPAEPVKLLPHEEKLLTFYVHPHENATPGGHYLALFVARRPTEGMIGIGSRVGVLLFLYTSGQVRESMDIQSFDSSNEFYFHSPFRVILRMRNTGDIHTIPQGVVSLQNMFGAVVDRWIVNASKRKVLPGGVFEETYTREKGGIGAVGPLNVVANIRYGATGQPLFANASFWYAPFAAIIFLILLLSICVLLWRKKQL